MCLKEARETIFWRQLQVTMRELIWLLNVLSSKIGVRVGQNIILWCFSWCQEFYLFSFLSSGITLNGGREWRRAGCGGGEGGECWNKRFCALVTPTLSHRKKKNEREKEKEKKKRRGGVWGGGGEGGECWNKRFRRNKKRSRPWCPVHFAFITVLPFTVNKELCVFLPKWK